MMDDVITREDTLNAINRIWDKCEEIEAHFPEGDPDKTGYKMIADYLTVRKYLSAQPEIIHCVDCKQVDFSGLRDGRCYCMAMGRYKHENDYCSDGERENDR